MTDKIFLPLSNGQSIEFGIYPQNTQWNATAGIYMFCRFDKDKWIPLYIGQTDDFQSRIPNHEQWPVAYKLGAQVVLAMSIPIQSSRDLLEKQLIQVFQPPLNQQLR